MRKEQGLFNTNDVSEDYPEIPPVNEGSKENEYIDENNETHMDDYIEDATVADEVENCDVNEDNFDDNDEENDVIDENNVNKTGEEYEENIEDQIGNDYNILPEENEVETNGFKTIKRFGGFRDLAIDYY